MNTDDLLHIGIVSAGRPGAVPPMVNHLDGLRHTWYVPVGEGGNYRYAGAREVVEVEGNLSDQRNAVLETAFADGRAAVELNDDLVNIRWTDDGKTQEMIGLPAALVRLHRELEASGFRFGGSATTTNLYFYREPIGRRHFIMAHMMMMFPGPERFDPAMRLKEDYDYTLQHLSAYGGVCRVNGLLANFRHYEKRGGCGPYRTPEEEERHVVYLLEKWPDAIRRNPRRDHEVLIKWPPKVPA